MSCLVNSNEQQWAAIPCVGHVPLWTQSNSSYAQGCVASPAPTYQRLLLLLCKHKNLYVCASWYVLSSIKDRSWHQVLPLATARPFAFGYNRKLVLCISWNAVSWDTTCVAFGDNSCILGKQTTFCYGPTLETCVLVGANFGYTFSCTLRVACFASTCVYVCRGFLALEAQGLAF